MESYKGSKIYDLLNLYILIDLSYVNRFFFPYRDNSIAVLINIKAKMKEQHK